MNFIIHHTYMDFDHNMRPVALIETEVCHIDNLADSIRAMIDNPGGAAGTTLSITVNLIPGQEVSI